ncbi:3-alpha-(or 20-beta)-hydroxysteroid dehydrogenase [Pseudonocardia autotrophica]|nr:3-alpha-(or 20-beta)-hydroxysteroid dehydrogenase [Pseudonocardia autotrophica]
MAACARHRSDRCVLRHQGGDAGPAPCGRRVHHQHRFRHGDRGTAHYAPYVAAKWALRGLTRTAALELGRDGIRVNVVHPGVIATPFITEPVAGAAAPIADFYSPDPFAVPRLGEPADISALVLFLASPAASFVTGSEYVSDGGLLLGPALR